MNFTFLECDQERKIDSNPTQYSEFDKQIEKPKLRTQITRRPHRIPGPNLIFGPNLILEPRPHSRNQPCWWAPPYCRARPYSQAPPYSYCILPIA